MKLIANVATYKIFIESHNRPTVKYYTMRRIFIFSIIFKESY